MSVRTFSAIKKPSDLPLDSLKLYDVIVVKGIKVTTLRLHLHRYGHKNKQYFSALKIRSGVLIVRTE